MSVGTFSLRSLRGTRGCTMLVPKYGMQHTSLCWVICLRYSILAPLRAQPSRFTLQKACRMNVREQSERLAFDWRNTLTWCEFKLTFGWRNTLTWCESSQWSSLCPTYCTDHQVLSMFTRRFGTSVCQVQLTSQVHRARSLSIFCMKHACWKFIQQWCCWVRRRTVALPVVEFGFPRIKNK